MKTIRNFVLAFLAVLSLPSFGAQPIFRDYFESGYADWSWSVSDCTHTYYTYEGIKSCYEYYPSAWTGFFAGSYYPADSTGYDAVCFAALALNSPINAANIVVKLKDQNQQDIGNGISLYSYIPYSPSQGGAYLNPYIWRKVCVPLTYLGGKNRLIGGIMIMSSVGNTSLVIDDLKLLNTGFETPGAFYTDGPAVNVVNESWANSHDAQYAAPAQTSPLYVHQGEQSFRVNFVGQWEGAKLRHTSGLSSAGKQYLQFWVNSPTAAQLQNIEVQLRGSGDAVIGSRDLGNVMTSFQNGVWTSVLIDLPSMLGTNYGQTIMSIVFLSQTGGVGEVYFDDINTSGGPFLRFPLDCSNSTCTSGPGFVDYRIGGPLTAQSVVSVVDHSMVAVYSSENGIVLAWNGEQGNANAQYPTTNQGCYPKTNGIAFSLSGSYVSDSCTVNRLNYDSHPGFDYKSSLGTPVRAAAGGVVVTFTTGERCIPKGIPAGCEAWGAVGIDHGNGYITQYLHLNSIFVSAGTYVSEAQIIGTSGQKAPSGIFLGPHLHFEVLKKIPGSAADLTNYKAVDPYGWQGPGTDPLESVTGVKNIWLWKP